MPLSPIRSSCLCSAAQQLLNKSIESTVRSTVYGTDAVAKAEGKEAESRFNIRIDFAFSELTYTADSVLPADPNQAFDVLKKASLNAVRTMKDSPFEWRTQVYFAANEIAVPLLPPATSAAADRHRAAAEGQRKHAYTSPYRFATCCLFRPANKHSFYRKRNTVVVTIPVYLLVLLNFLALTFF